MMNMHCPTSLETDMHYTINVAKGKQHFFATADHSLTSRIEYLKILPVIVEKFPASEGYSIMVTYWEKVGRPQNMVEDMAAAYEQRDEIAKYRSET